MVDDSFENKAENQERNLAMRKYISILILIILLMGCSREMTQKNDNHLEEEKETYNDRVEEKKHEKEIEEKETEYAYMEVYSDVDRYQLSMSSVPGLPIIIECYSSDYEGNQRLTIVCESGELIRWQNDGSVVVEGERYHGKYVDTTIYWRPIETEDIKDTIELEFYGYVGSESLIKTVCSDEDGYYLK